MNDMPLFLTLYQLKNLSNFPDQKAQLVDKILDCLQNTLFLVLFECKLLPLI